MLCSENNGADQQCCDYVFAYANRWVSNAVAHMVILVLLYVQCIDYLCT